MTMSSFFALVISTVLVVTTQAGTYQQDGLTIETSERRLATVNYGGSCMSITCSYNPQNNGGNSKTVSGLILQQYNPDSAAYNIVVETISVSNPNPQNTAAEYKTTSSSIDAESASVSVDVFGQSVCQYARYQCVVEFESSQDQPLIVREEDELPFTEITTNEEWLRRVTDFIKDQMTSVNQRLIDHVIDLEAKIVQVQEGVNDEVKKLNDELKQHTEATQTRLEENSVTVSSSLSSLEEATATQVSTLKDGLASALSSLQSDLQTQITTAEAELNEKISEATSSLTSTVQRLTESTNNQLSSAESEVDAQINLLSGNVSQVAREIETSVIALDTELTSKVADLGQDLDSKTQEVLEAGQASADSLRSASSEASGAAVESVSAGVSSVNNAAEAVKVQVDTGIETLQQESSTQTQSLTDQVSTGVKRLETDVTVQLSSLADSVGSSITELDVSVLSTASTLTSDLAALESSNNVKVDELQGNVTKAIESLNNDLTSGLSNTSSTVEKKVAEFDSAVVQLSESLLSQLGLVHDSTNTRFSGLGAAAEQGLSQLESDMQSKLSILVNDTTSKMRDLSQVLSDNSGVENAVTSKLQELQANIDAKIGEVSDLISTLVRSTSEDQGKTITAIGGDFETKLEQLETNVKNLNTKITQSLTETSSQIKADVEATENQVLPVINELSTSTAQKIISAEQNLAGVIETAGTTTAEQVSDIQTKTTDELSVISQLVETKSANVSTTNSATSSSLNNLADDSKQVQAETTSLDQSLNATGASCDQLSSKLTTLDENLVTAETSSQEAFQGLATSVADISAGHSKEIDTLNSGLTTMQASWTTSRDETSGTLSSINTYLTNTSESLVAELVYNFNVLDEMIDQTDDTLTSYLSPEECKQGMGFMASSSLQYVVIHESETQEYEFLCDAHTDGGGWIVIQRRTSGDTEFYRDWEDYKNGFGSVTEDFWIGLQRVYQLTKRNDYVLRVDMTYQGTYRFAEYATFSIGDEASNYKMTLGDYTGTAGDSMADTNGLGFSTYDRDNDSNRYGNCAVDNVGAWWYNNCQYSNLNGVWGQKDVQGPRWNSFTGTMPVVTSEMKIRLKDAVSFGS